MAGEGAGKLLTVFGGSGFVGRHTVRALRRFVQLLKNPARILEKQLAS